MLAIVCPGQGAQTPGFLAPWLEDDSFATRFEWLSTVASLDLIHYGTEADAETIRDTAIAQPLLVAAGLVTSLALFPNPAEAFGLVGVGAGHSVGEITAAAASGVLTAEQAMVLVRERGRLMAEASAVEPTSMMALVGGDAEAVMETIERHGLTAANNNGTGQIVAAGTVEKLEAMAKDLPRRVRAMQLSVAGAFHTHHMAPAVDRLQRLQRAISTHDPRVRLLSNRDGAVVQDGREVLDRIVGQVARPVRWDLCMETMADLGVTGLLELPPAGTLTGIAKRNLKGVDLFKLNTPDQLEDAVEFVRKHAEPSSDHELSRNPAWRLVVSPGKGEFTRTDGLTAGQTLPPGSTVGTVTNSRGDVSVDATRGGVVVEILAEDGDPVSPGQPLVRLHPTAENSHHTEVTR